jgi:hypothetical protein
MRHDRYVRRVSSEEAREGYVLVLKDHLDVFPPVGSPFHVVQDGRRRRLRVGAVPCECRGPEAPHAHYRIHWSGLHAGDRITFHRDPVNSEGYIVRLERGAA